jgi:hypothetical protein
MYLHLIHKDTASLNNADPPHELIGRSKRTAANHHLQVEIVLLTGRHLAQSVFDIRRYDP